MKKRLNRREKTTSDLEDIEETSYMDFFFFFSYIFGVGTERKRVRIYVGDHNKEVCF